ncbi:pyruvate, phosphate dikinase [Amycolatopsis pithecellobii]|uniref:Pyruvate, phosphate dikinase n=1 Tax=Amycolatopsis pithecellobii TaxID=664692 RepID=A0A6N7Z7B9_9PSEU|nr:pyruvate, phosphate dikinase [Amycolatopsis pithecellobii]MTD56940.1 pyruvate, phosphate dikinase [Amycolatopsis pithecellobii]
MSTMPAGAPRVLILDGHPEPSPALVGGKAAGIARMTASGLPVPPAFVLTTEVCREFLAHGERVVDSLADEISGGMAFLARRTGRTFGSSESPLLVSVRSGAATSMPGMMDTVLNLGVNQGVLKALSAGHGADYADDIRARFERGFREIVEVDDIPVDPWAQLRLAIAAVFRSWLSPRAVAYRRRHGLDDAAGTAVTVQAMVFGNADAESGTGVLFTRDPATGTAEPFGEWLAGAQGEDVVSGVRAPLPLSALAELLPQVHAQLLDYGRRLEKQHRDVQDIEFTVQSGHLWLLQTRSAKRSPLAAVRFAVALVREGLISPHEAAGRVTPDQVRASRRPGLDPVARRAAPLLARGLPVCPGAGSGVVVTDPDEAESRAEREPVVLARPTTSPHDLPGMIAATAIVTEVGGATSHAALVSRELGVPCVVGCGEGSLAGLAGEVVTVCGETGEVRKGAVPVAEISAAAGEDLRLLAEWSADSALSGTEQ